MQPSESERSLENVLIGFHVHLGECLSLSTPLFVNAAVPDILLLHMHTIKKPWMFWNVTGHKHQFDLNPNPYNPLYLLQRGLASDNQLIVKTTACTESPYLEVTGVTSKYQGGGYNPPLI